MVLSFLTPNLYAFCDPSGRPFGKKGFADVPQIKYVSKPSYVAYCGQLSHLLVIKQII
jgi:hypothetical protein